MSNLVSRITWSGTELAELSSPARYTLPQEAAQLTVQNTTGFTAQVTTADDAGKPGPGANIPPNSARTITGAIATYTLTALVGKAYQPGGSVTLTAYCAEGAPLDTTAPDEGPWLDTVLAPGPTAINLDSPWGGSLTYNVSANGQEVPLRVRIGQGFSGYISLTGAAAGTLDIGANFTGNVEMAGSGFGNKQAVQIGDSCGGNYQWGSSTAGLPDNCGLRVAGGDISNVTFESSASSCTVDIGPNGANNVSLAGRNGQVRIGGGGAANLEDSISGTAAADYLISVGGSSTGSAEWSATDLVVKVGDAFSGDLSLAGAGTVTAGDGMAGDITTGAGSTSSVKAGDTLTGTITIPANSATPVIMVRNGYENSITMASGVHIERDGGRNVFVQQSEAVTANGGTGTLFVGDLTEISVKCDITDVSGTSPTLILTLSELGADGVSYTVWTSPTETAAGQVIASIGRGLTTDVSFGQNVALTWTVGGTTPSFTFSVSMDGK